MVAGTAYYGIDESSIFTPLSPLVIHTLSTNRGFGVA